MGVPAPIEGTLEEVLVTVGEEVRQDQTLAHIRNTAIEADVKSAQDEVSRAEGIANRMESLFLTARLEASRASADLSRAQAEVYQAEKAAARQQMLHREGATPRRAYEQAQAESRAKEKEYEILRAVARTSDDRVSAAQQDVDKARAGLAEKRADLEMANGMLLASEVISPVDGVVTAITAAAGEEVNPEKGDLFQIAADLSTMEAILDPAPPLLEKVRPGQPAAVYITEARNEALPGSVRAVENGKVIVEFASPSPLIRPGLTAQVRIDIR